MARRFGHFNPSQRRDRHGRWTRGGGGTGLKKKVSAKRSASKAKRNSRTPAQKRQIKARRKQNVNNVATIGAAGLLAYSNYKASQPKKPSRVPGTPHPTPRVASYKHDYAPPRRAPIATPYIPKAAAKATAGTKVAAPKTKVYARGSNVDKVHMREVPLRMSSTPRGH